MRRFVVLAAVLALAAPLAARAEEKEKEKPDCKAVIEKAIKAQGDEEKLGKIKAFTFKMKGKFYGGNEEGIDYTGEIAIQLPDKQRMKIDGEANGQKVTFLIRVVNGDKVWQKMGDSTEEVTDKDKIKEAKEERYAEHVVALLPLVKDKEFKLEPLGEAKVGGKPAVGVRVSQKGHRDVNLFFDKDSGLLVKSERTVKDDQTDKEVTQETLYSDYKERGGVTRFTKMVMNRDGKKFVDAEITDFEVKDKLDDATFDKP